ncbi:ClbS/DfsB family four-helix bundle protein [Luethyella okanaganae]|uniref:ClbS/DfsB family four-helix bundle protein n=1 Tax=Luethyella okanaganae TaxID=69372 RepID=A0ABW1VIP8_9MICO
MRSERARLETALCRVEERGLFGAIAVDAWTVKDVLAIRARWTEMVAAWVIAGVRGETPRTPALGYTWGETPRLNADIVAAEADATPAQLRHRLGAALASIELAVSDLSDEDLLSTGRFSWTRAWCVSRWVSTNTITQYASLGRMVRRVLRAAAEGTTG